MFGLLCQAYAVRGRPRPPFFPAADAISLRRLAESFAARAFPPIWANSEIVSGFFTPQSYHDRHNSISALLFIRSIYRTRGNVERNELALITRSDDHARIITMMENVHACQSAFLFAAGHGLPWTAAILGKKWEDL